MSIAPISPERWESAWSADLDVLRNLRSNGDRPEAIREIDVSFRGPIEALRALAEASGNFGFAVQRLIEADDFEGQPWLFLVRDQCTDEDSMRELTQTYLQIEDSFGVECDGWGCMASNENGPISKENPA